MKQYQLQITLLFRHHPHINYKIKGGGFSAHVIEKMFLNVIYQTSTEKKDDFLCLQYVAKIICHIL